MCMIFVNEDSNPDLCDAGAVLDQLSYLDPVDVSISIIHGLASTYLTTKGLFLKSPETFRAYFGCLNSRDKRKGIEKHFFSTHLCNALHHKLQ